MVTDRLLDTIDVLDQARNYAAKEKIRDVWILGDLFDKRLVDAVTLKYVIAVLQRMIDNRLFVRLVPGNHEAADGAGKHFILDALTSIGCWVAGTSAPHGEPVKTGAFDNDPVFLPLPYQPDKIANDWVKDWLKLCPEGIPMIHQSIQGGKMGSWVCPDGIDATALSGFRHTLSGHFHTRQTFGPKNNITYIGAPMQHNFGDEGEVRGWTVLTVGNKGEIKQQLVPSQAPRFHAVAPDDGDETLVESMAQVGQGDYVMVKSKSMDEAKKVCALLTPMNVRAAKPSLIPAETQAKQRMSQAEDGGRMTWGAVVEGYMSLVPPESKLDPDLLRQIGMELISEAEALK